MSTTHLESLLRMRFGFQEFRPGQREAIETLLSQGKLLCIHPTGRGKSLLYQLPSCLLDGLTVVISPLLALMRDQIDQLNRRFKIPAAAINTDQSEEENGAARFAALNGKIKILFLAPEQLDHVDRFHFLLSLPISLIVVDEAHCISTWGHDFRPSYRQISHLLSHVQSHNPHIKMLGLTATANSKVEEDIRKQLGGGAVVTLRDSIELQKMLTYSRQTGGCRMATLREALGDVHATHCGHCDACRPRVEPICENGTVAMKWLQDRSFPIPPVALHKVSAGVSLLDSKVRSPLFVRFMKERAVVSSYQEMDSELIDLLLRQFTTLIQDKTIGAIIPLPSTTWKARDSIVELLSCRFQIPILNALSWKDLPLKRQGELLNNDQRHHNVHQRMEVCFSAPPPRGCLILFDDYIGSGNTLKEAARAIRATKTISNQIIPFTIAAVKWHLGKPGFA